MIRKIGGLIFIFSISFLSQPKVYAQVPSTVENQKLRISKYESAGTISIFRSNGSEPILTQNARVGIRPYIHPIVAPDGNGLLTQYRPKHHLHQTGLYWGLKLVNGRDFFMNWEKDYWRRISANITEQNGEEVKWQTVYDLLDKRGNVVLRETQNWSMQEVNGKYILDLEWKGNSRTEITLGKYYVGGLFLRMPWQEGDNGEIVNSSGEKNQEAEAQRAIWADVGIQVPGRDDRGHITIFDHPNNRSFPTPWRVDSQLGVGPSIQILDDWKISNGSTEIIRYRLVAYTGKLNKKFLTQTWKEFVCKY